MAGFEFRFVAMGMGDCTLIKCPDDKIIIVDCGTSSEGSYNDPEPHFVAAKNWLIDNAKNNKVHAAILTHADMDHYNRFKDMLSITGIIDEEGDLIENIQLENVYFSCPAEKPATDPMDQYKISDIGYNMCMGTYGKTNVHLVVLNDPSGNSNGYLTYQKHVDEYNVATFKSKPTKISGTPGKLNVAKDNQLNPDWSVDIVAGNVGLKFPELDDSEIKNANSLIVLITYKGKKMLITGDAASQTQDYLIDSTLINEIENLDLMTVPHHGSGKNFYATFCNKIKKLDAIVISSEYFEHKHNIPNFLGTTEKWVAKVGTDRNDHYTHYWDLVPPNEVEAIEKLADLWYDFTTDKLKNPYKVEFDSDYSICRWEPDEQNRFLIRFQKKQTKLMKQYKNKKNVYQTSQGTVLVSLDQDGISLDDQLTDKDLKEIEKNKKDTKVE
jgi:beta-lactamase superfamily II metal-dependent hydrolase